MATIAEQLEALTLRDDFNRADEDPMVSANWTKLSWCKTTGKVQSEHWTPTTGFVTQEDGAYWNPSAFINPAGIIGDLYKENLAERWGAVWVALNPATQSGYRLRLVQTTTSSKLEWRIEKVAEGEVELLDSGFVEGLPATGDTEHSFALTCVDGEVKAWVSKEGGAWEELGTAADNAFTEGNVAIEGRGFGVNRFDNFFAGGLESEGGEGEPGEVKPPPANATASAPSPAVAMIATPDAAAAVADIAVPTVAAGPSPSSTNENVKGLPLPHPSILANPSRLGPPRFTALERKTLGIED